MSEGQEQQPKPRIVQFEGEQGRIQQVNLNDLEAVFANIEAHNREFSLGAMLGKGIISHIKSQEDSENPTPLSPFSAEKDKRDVLNETLEILHADSLSPIGISFTSSGEGATIMTGDEEIAETQIELAIQNPDLFLSFLDGISQGGKDLGDGKISKMLTKIGLDTGLQIWRNYRYTNSPKDERLELITGRLRELVSKFRGLGIKTRWEDRSLDLDDYAKYAEKGILKEYLVADEAMLFNKPEKQKEGNYKEWFEYGCLAAWWGDLGTSEVQHRYDTAISTIQYMKINPKARELVQEAKANLANCINVTLRDMDSKNDSWDKENEWVKRKEKKEIFENARINLQLI